MNIILRPTRLHWISDDQTDEPGDLCAHSPVKFQIGSDVLVSEEEGDYSVNGSVITLLRTLFYSHTKEKPQGEHVFPFLAHCFYEEIPNEKVVILGRPHQGTDFSIVHEKGSVIIQTKENKKYQLPLEKWQKAVCSFADEVHEFYYKNTAKDPDYPVEWDAFGTFLQEWDNLRSQVEHPCPPSLYQDWLKRRITPPLEKGKRKSWFKKLFSGNKK